MIGLFKKKEQNIKIDFLNSFNWIKNLDKQKLKLSNQDIEKRLSQSKLVNEFTYHVSVTGYIPYKNNL